MSLDGKNLETPIESSVPEKVNQDIRQLTEDQVLKKIKDRKSNFIASFVLGCVVIFIIIFYVQKFF